MQNLPESLNMQIVRIFCIFRIVFLLHAGIMENRGLCNTEPTNNARLFYRGI